MRIHHYIICIAAIVVASMYILDATYETRKNDNWVAPYLSAAANLKFGGDFNINNAEVLAFKELSPEDQYQYQFQPSANTVHYNHNPVGFAYVIWLATHVFPFAGDIYGLICLQLVTHILLCLLLLTTIRNKTFQLTFFLLYAINPLVINIVVLDYYYFWQCVPGFILIYMITTGMVRLRILAVLTLLMVLATLARPTILLLSIFTIILYFKYAPKWFALSALMLFGLSFLLLNKPTEKNIWHTIYVGIAAYPNSEVFELSDDEGYALYQKATGTELNASFGGNYYEKQVIDKYQEITKHEVVRIAEEHPVMFIRNALLNTLQCFSIGYINLGYYWINILSAVLGLLFLVLLLISRQYIIITGIILSTLAFCLYYPPIQAYLFGAYALSAFGFFRILVHFFPHKISFRGPATNHEKAGLPKVLYICSNDGSDMRINKELRSLSAHYEITFIGVGQSNTESYARHHCKYFYLIIGRRNRVVTMIKQIALVLKLKPERYDSIHIINEQLMVFFYPFLFGRHVVLDIFDSIFLMWNKSRNKWLPVKRIVYAPVDVILVTDANRMALMPEFTHKKIKILENFPYRYTESIQKQTSEDTVTILYSGWLGQHRGTEVINHMLRVDTSLRVIMAGWFADDMSRDLSKHPQVDYRGIMTQEESLRIAAHESDYILCVYAPNNENNINASPNKIYDAIQTSTPVIINKEIRIAEFVEQHNIGILIENYHRIDPVSLIECLKAKKHSFQFSETLKNTYTWENIEQVLLSAHQV